MGGREEEIGGAGGEKKREGGREGGEGSSGREREGGGEGEGEGEGEEAAAGTLPQEAVRVCVPSRGLYLAVLSLLRFTCASY